MSDEYYGNQGSTAPVPPAGAVGYTQPLPAAQTAPAQDAQAGQTWGQHAAGGYQAYQPYQVPQAATAAGAKAKKGGAGKTFLAGFGGAACACALAGALAFGTGAVGAPSTQAQPQTSTQVVLGAPADASSIVAADGQSGDRAEVVAAKALPSVVAIDVYVDSSQLYGSYFGWGQMGGSSSGELTKYGSGSGVIISSDGYILTNNHVVEDGEEIHVTAGGDEYVAQVVGTDPSSDLAVLKIDATGLQAIEIGTSSNIVPGQWVMTVGSPFGLEQSVATGIISSTSRTVTIEDESSYYGGTGEVSVYPGMIQTDAVINPGNSGGALVDENGRLIGINSVLSSTSGNYAGVGFAIPVDYAMNIATQIIDGKTPTHAMLGVSVATLSSQNAASYGVQGVAEGAYVSYVYEGGAADAAGIEQGDVITKVGSTPIESSTDLIAAVRLVGVGEQVEVTLVRDGREQTVTATLGSDEEELVEPVDTNSGWNNHLDIDDPQGTRPDGDDGDRFSYDDLMEMFEDYLRNGGERF